MRKHIQPQKTKSKIIDIVEVPTHPNSAQLMGKTCIHCGKDNHFKDICLSIQRAGRPQVQGSGPIADVEQNGNENWQNSEDETYRHIDAVNLMYEF